MNVLISLEGEVEPETRWRAERTLLRCFWSDFDGWLLHPRVAEAVLGRVNLDCVGTAAILENILTRYHGVLTPRALISRRIELLGRWLDAQYPEAVNATGHLLIDYLALQHACAVDVRRAGRIAGPLEPLGSILGRMEEGEMLVSRQIAEAIILGRP